MKLCVCIVALTILGGVGAQAQQPATNPSSTPDAATSSGTPQEKQKNAASATQDNSGISGDQVTKPAGAKASTVIGCLGGPDSDGNYTLKSMQYRAGVTVLGLDDMKQYAGDKVKLTGTWQASADQPSAAKSARRFQATEVEVVSQHCQAPTATTPISKKKQQQKAESSSQ